MHTALRHSIASQRKWRWRRSRIYHTSICIQHYLKTSLHVSGHTHGHQHVI